MKTLNELTKKLKFNYQNQDINETNFPTISRGKVTKMFKFKNSFNKEEDIKKLDEKDYRPATAWELLNWATENWNGKDWIVALGQEWLDADGNSRVLVLWSRDGNRRLDLYWTSAGWGSDARVAGVRKSKFDSKTLSPDSDSLTLRLNNLEERLIDLENKFNF